jgi:protoporphyrinogen oxidase
MKRHAVVIGAGIAGLLAARSRSTTRATWAGSIAAERVVDASGRAGGADGAHLPPGSF